MPAFGGSIPEWYDRILGVAQFEVFGADLARRLPPRPSGDVLEIACGTGIVTRHLRSRLDPQRRLVATDLSPEMVAFARRKFSDVAGIEWREADALRLPFADGAFGAVVIALGIMFFPDKKAAMKEARRVLRAGGRLLLNVWDGLENNPQGRANAEVMERLFPGDPEMRFAAVPYVYNDRRVIEALLEECGFRSVRFETARYEVGSESAHDWAVGQMRGTPRGSLVEKKGRRLDDVIDEVAAGLARVGGERPFRVQAQTLVIEAEAA